MGKRLITAEVSARIRTLVKEGKSDAQIAAVLADEVGILVGTNAISQHRLRYGIEPGSAYRKVVVRHGTASGYVIHKCGCEECTRWNSDRMRKYVARLAEEDRRSGKIERSGRPWEDWEDRIVADRSRPVREIARMLHRTQAAVRLRRDQLKSLTNA